MEQLFNLAPFIAIAVLFYLLLVRPQRRQQAELAEMRANLKKNDRVVTIGGIMGTVTMVQQGSDEVTIKVDENNNTKLRMKRSAIDHVVVSDAAAEAKKVSG
jgi:preprotein translocase subunit YajC